MKDKEKYNGSLTMSLKYFSSISYQLKYYFILKIKM